ncbi:MAG: HAD family hydrolase [Acidobacteria bacterium]|nr:HAD family hydrolase [Acidobacteriota bacterium]
MTTTAVFFDVDFTLIRPGRRFLGPGYAETCARHGVPVDEAAFAVAVAASANLLDSPDQRYHDEIFVRYTSRIIELRGGSGPGVAIAAREIYDDWAHHHHFEMYDDVPDALRALQRQGVRMGLISNSHRSLVGFQEHFALHGLMTVAVSSAEFGVMKPDPRIFQEALDQMQVSAANAVMVGDSLPHDVLGARQMGMRGVWLDRDGRREQATNLDVTIPVIGSLQELPAWLTDTSG